MVVGRTNVEIVLAPPSGNCKLLGGIFAAEIRKGDVKNWMAWFSIVALRRTC